MATLRGTRLGLLAAVAILVAPGTVSAHLHKTVGPFDTVVGWRSEPVIQGQMNGLDVDVLTAATDLPVAGAEKTLKAAISFGARTETLELTPEFNKPGFYTAPLLPSQPGDYAVRLTGTVNGLPFDATYDLGSDPDMVVQPLSAFAFPPVAADSAPPAVTATAPPVTSAAPPASPIAPVWAVWLPGGLGAAGLAMGGLAWVRGMKRGTP